MMTTVSTQRTPFGDISNQENAQESRTLKSKRAPPPAIQPAQTFQNGPEQVKKSLKFCEKEPL